MNVTIPFHIKIPNNQNSCKKVTNCNKTAHLLTIQMDLNCTFNWIIVSFYDTIVATYEKDSSEMAQCNYSI